MFKEFGNDCKKAMTGLLGCYTALSVTYTSLTIVKNLIELFF